MKYANGNKNNYQKGKGLLALMHNTGDNSHEYSNGRQRRPLSEFSDKINTTERTYLSEYA